VAFTLLPRKHLPFFPQIIHWTRCPFESPPALVLPLAHDSPPPTSLIFRDFRGSTLLAPFSSPSPLKPSKSPTPPSRRGHLVKPPIDSADIALLSPWRPVPSPLVQPPYHFFPCLPFSSLLPGDHCSTLIRPGPAPSHFFFRGFKQILAHRPSHLQCASQLRGSPLSFSHPTTHPPGQFIPNKEILCVLPRSPSTALLHSH